jgi:alkylhydroperoxidase family enzyme
VRARRGWIDDWAHLARMNAHFTDEQMVEIIAWVGRVH